MARPGTREAGVDREAARIVRELAARGRPAAVAGMARYGIRPGKAFGVSIPVLRALAKEVGRDHDLAIALWRTGVHEARILASMIADPARATPALREAWTRDFDSWDVCDQVCMNLFEDVPGIAAQALRWSRRDEEFVKRAGYVMMARLAVSDKGAADASFARFFPAIRRGATDPRNYVKKAVSWALREIGKRRLEPQARALAADLAASANKPARWIGRDALRDLDAAAARRAG